MGHHFTAQGVLVRHQKELLVMVCRMQAVPQVVCWDKGVPSAQVLRILIITVQPSEELFISPFMAAQLLCQQHNLTVHSVFHFFNCILFSLTHYERNFDQTWITEDQDCGVFSCYIRNSQVLKPVQCTLPTGFLH